MRKTNREKNETLCVHYVSSRGKTSSIFSHTTKQIRIEIRKDKYKEQDNENFKNIKTFNCRILYTIDMIMYLI